MEVFLKGNKNDLVCRLKAERRSLRRDLFLNFGGKM